MQILLIHGDGGIAARRAAILATEDLIADSVACFGDALDYLEQATFDVIVPEINPGDEPLARLVAGAAPVPVVVWSDSCAPEMVRDGFAAGAADVCTAFASTDEILARLDRAVCRSPISSAVDLRQTADEMGLRVDVDRCLVFAGGRKVRLTRQQFTVFNALRLARGRVVSKDSLMQSLYGEEECRTKSNVDVHICKIRAVLRGMAWIETIWGLGYRLRREGERDASAQLSA